MSLGAFPIFYQGSRLGSSLSRLQEGALKSIQVDGGVYAFLVGHGMGPGQSASDVLRQALFHAIDIDDELYAYLMSLASSPGDTANTILRRELDIHANPPPVGPLSHVEFHIPGQDRTGTLEYTRPAGDGGGRANAEIYNDDNVNHRLHTDGVPFPHSAADTAPGTSSDFVLHDVFALERIRVSTITTSGQPRVFGSACARPLRRSRRWFALDQARRFVLFAVRPLFPHKQYQQKTLDVAQPESAKETPRAKPRAATEPRRTICGDLPMWITRLGFGRDAMDRIANHKTSNVTDVYDRHGYAKEELADHGGRGATRPLVSSNGTATSNVISLR